MKKILLIEDNEDFRINTQEIIELSNFEVITAENGVVGVEKAIVNKPDLIICDVMMPQLDGYGVLNILSKNPDTSGIPFIFLTAKAEKSDVRYGMNLGADDYLLKPFNEETLINAINTRIERNEKIKTQLIKSIAKGEPEEVLGTDNAIDLLIKNRKIKSFKEKEEIYREGDFANYLYFLLKGKVKCFKCDSYGKSFVTEIFHTTEFFGYMSILEDREHGESAQAIQDCEVAIIPKDDFLELVAKNREVSAKFLKMLAGNVRLKEERLLQLAYAPVRERIALALIDLAVSDGEKIDDKIEIKISRDDLANIVGTAKESLVRLLSSYKSEGIIDLKTRAVIINDLDALKKNASLV